METQTSEPCLALRETTPGSPDWDEAVANKRERAYAMAEAEGFSRDQIEQRYADYRRAKTRDFHDEMLRREVGAGRLLTWWRGGRMVAYAPIATAPLLGDESYLIFTVADVWAEPSLPEAEREQVVGDLLDQARAEGAVSLNVHCDDMLAQANQRLGGLPTKHWFRFPLPRQA